MYGQRHDSSRSTLTSFQVRPNVLLLRRVVFRQFTPARFNEFPVVNVKNVFEKNHFIGYSKASLSRLVAMAHSNFSQHTHPIRRFPVGVFDIHTIGHLVYFYTHRHVLHFQSGFVSTKFSAMPSTDPSSPVLGILSLLPAAERIGGIFRMPVSIFPAATSPRFCERPLSGLP